MKILLAGFEGAARACLEQTLHDLGHEVARIEVGAAAGAPVFAEGDPYELAIVEAFPPHPSQDDLCKRLKAARPGRELYVIFALRNPSSADLFHAVSSGADDCLTLGHDESELRARLRIAQRTLDTRDELTRTQQALRIEATHDALSGVKNRASILQMLDAELSRSGREQTSLGLLLADLDHFQKINDAVGRAGGDEVLREVARRLQAGLRPYDGIGRYGGEELLIVLPACDSPGLVNAAERLRARVNREAFGTARGDATVTLSFGMVVSHPDCRRSAETLLRAAELALARAKKAGCDRVELALDCEYASAAPVDLGGSPRRPTVQLFQPDGGLGYRPVRSEPPSELCVLLVDDDPGVLKAYARLLSTRGYEVHVADSGRGALSCLEKKRYGVIITDILMPGMSGLELLRGVRERDLDVPVILITGKPDLKTAQEAIEAGALRYLAKPVQQEQLTKVVEDAARLHSIAMLKRRAMSQLGVVDRQLGDVASLEVGFRRAIAGLFIAFQPVVNWTERNIFGYEALMRTVEPTLPHPGAMLDAAERLSRIHELGRAVRSLTATAVERTSLPGRIFVNLHSQDLVDEELYDPSSPLSTIASRVVLEITERASLTDVRDVRDRIARLRKMGFRIAVDDLGAGYAGLTSFAQLEPELVKLDMSLVRNADKEPTKRKLIQSLASLCGEMNIQVVAEGIETVLERDSVVGLGCELLQGYLFARPSAEPPTKLDL